jgi:hypothetical protein
MLAVPNLKTDIMKNLKRILLLVTLCLMASQISFANNDKDKTKTTTTENAKVSKVYVVVKSATVTKKFMDHYGSELKDDLAEKGIKAEYALLTGKFPNAMYQIAMDNGADHIVFINQVRQFNIDGKTNVGGMFEVKSFDLKNYSWTIISNDIKMNVQFNKSIKSANDRIIESFLSKI